MFCLVFVTCFFPTTERLVAETLLSLLFFSSSIQLGLCAVYDPDWNQTTGCDLCWRSVHVRTSVVSHSIAALPHASLSSSSSSCRLWQDGFSQTLQHHGKLVPTIVSQQICEVAQGHFRGMKFREWKQPLVSLFCVWTPVVCYLSTRGQQVQRNDSWLSSSCSAGGTWRRPQGCWGLWFYFFLLFRHASLDLVHALTCEIQDLALTDKYTH